MMLRDRNKPLLLQTFRVKGYKNLTHEITFGPLGRINVIHGENNLGKSNLLQAMDLFFRLLDLSSMGGERSLFSDFASIGHPVNEIFNLTRPGPIEMTGVLWIAKDRLERAGLETSMPGGTRQIEISVRLKQIEHRVEHRIAEFAFGSGQERRTAFDSGLLQRDAKDIKRFLSGLYLLQTGKRSSHFVLLGVNRRLMVEDTTPPGLHIVPQRLRDALFDAKESREATMVRRWELFLEAMKQFAPILGPGRFDTAFDRGTNQADLVLDSGEARVPVDLLGSGVQQIVALLGQLLMTPATLVGIEEPELNLRYTLQKQLLAAFQEITRSEYGPEQLFLTSHSPAFEAEETFFAMEYRNNVPTLGRKPRALARVYTRTRDEEDRYPEMHARQPEPVCYVSSEGLVMLPEDVRKTLKVESGGGVSFIPDKETGRFEIWTTDEVERRLAGDDDLVERTARYSDARTALEHIFDELEKQRAAVEGGRE